MPKKNKLFTVLDKINTKQGSYKYDKRDCSSYMLLMWLSHSDDCIKYCQKMNEVLFDVPDEVVYTYLYKSIPPKQRYLKWTKGTKEKALLKKEQKIIQYLMDEKGFSKYESMIMYKLYIKEIINAK